MRWIFSLVFLHVCGASTSFDVPGTNNLECNDVSKFKEDAPGIALAIDKQQNQCWRWGNHHNKDFNIKPLQIYSSRAYTITGPKTMAKRHRVSHNTIWLSFDKKGQYKIYVVGHYGDLHEVGNVTVAEANTFVKIPVLADKTKTVVVAPASTVIATTTAPLAEWPEKGEVYEVIGDENHECKDSLEFKEDAPRIALAVDKQQGSCWRGGGFNHRNFTIQPVRVGTSRAYKITGPRTKAKNFAASKNTIWLSFPRKGSYTISVVDENGKLQEAGTVTVPKRNVFVKIPVLADKSKTVVVSPVGTSEDGATTTKDKSGKEEPAEVKSELKDKDAKDTKVTEKATEATSEPKKDKDDARTTTISKPDPCTCTKIMKPVCDKDGNTYANECIAKCAKVQIVGNAPCKRKAATLPSLLTYSLEKKGNPVDASGTKNLECNDVSSFKEDAPGLALALDKQQNQCWRWGNHHHSDFTIQQGVVGSHRAYHISGPKTMAKRHRVSHNTIWLSFDKKGSYKVYTMGKHGDVHEQGNITAPEANTFVKTPVVADADKTIVVVAASTRFSAWHRFGFGADGATLWQDSHFKVTVRRWDLPAGQPFDPSKDFQLGPADYSYTYGDRKYFFPVSNNGTEGVVWQDQTTLKVYLTWLKPDFLGISNIELPTHDIPEPILDAAAGNGKGEVVGRV